MDISHLLLSHPLVNQVIGAVLVILLWKFLPFCFNLLMKTCQKLKTIIGFTTPISDSVNSDSVECEVEQLPLDNTAASSSDSVKCEYGVVSRKNETLDQLSLGDHNYNELMEDVNTNPSSDPIQCDYEVFCQKTETLKQFPPCNINDRLKEEVNAESSSLDSLKCDDYEVFLSFRGADTRTNFVSHLYKELKRKGIHTFMDDRELERGKTLSFLLEVIEKSKITIVVFSPNYASSDWCLDELVKMVECRESKEQVILPIFYNINLDEQTEFYSKALEDHQNVFENDKIKKWGSALSTVVKIAGWDSRKCGNDATLIEYVVRDVLDRLICKSSSLETCLAGIDSHVMSHLVGIDYHVRNVDAKLGFEFNDVRMVGIWGIGGVGKTTIADFIYCRDSDKYEASCCLKKVKDKYKNGGAIMLQKELISQILSEKNLDIWDEGQGCDIICRRFRSKRVLILLDDVDELEQLKVLAYDLRWFGQGSLPLALKILGISLYKREMDFWQNELEKLKRIPNVKIYRIMKISYDGLEDSVQNVFLDIAFFFIGKSKITVENALDHALRAFTILEERALLTISNDKLEMHDQIKMMAYEIVREEAKDPRKRSRLCHPEDVYRALTNCEGATSIEGIYLNRSELKKPIHLKPNVFSKLDHLRILCFVWGCEIHLPKELNSLPNELKFLCWDGFPQKTLPFNSFGENLVHLDLEESKLECLWEGEVELGNLRVINLCNCKHLKVFPKFSKAPSLEKIYLGGCSGFKEFSDDLIQLDKLKILDLRNTKLDKLPVLSLNLVELYLSCASITELPSRIQFFTKLKILELDDCKKLKTLPIEIGALESLTEIRMDYSAIEELPQSFSKLKSLGTVLRLEHVAITSLPETIGEMKWLTKLELEEATIIKLPKSIGELNSLEELCLIRVPIVELPRSIGHLHKLKVLNLNSCSNLVRLPSCMHKLVSLEDIDICYCKSLDSLPELPPSLESLSVKYCESLESLQCNDWIHFKKLRQPDFSKCNKLNHRALCDLMAGTRVMVHRNESFDFNYKWTQLYMGIRYIFPGKTIPEWFDYSSSELSITVKFPSSPHQIRGFTFCALCHGQMCTEAVRSDSLNLKSSVYLMPFGSHDSYHVLVWYYHFDDSGKDVLMPYLGCEVQFMISYLGNYKDITRKWGIYVIPNE